MQACNPIVEAAHNPAMTETREGKLVNSAVIGTVFAALLLILVTFHIYEKQKYEFNNKKS